MEHLVANNKPNLVKSVKANNCYSGFSEVTHKREVSSIGNVADM